MACRRGDFSQLCCDRSWKRTMAAACNESLVGGSGDHIRDVAMIVAVKKVDCENDVISSRDRIIRLKSGGGYS